MLLDGPHDRGNTQPIDRPAAPIPRRIRVAIVDDHSTARAGIRALLDSTTDFDVCGEAASVVGAVQLVRETAPDVVLLDLTLGQASGRNILTELAGRPGAPRFVVLSVSDESVMGLACLLEGASGYVMKSEPASVVISAIRRAAKGQVHASASLRDAAARAVSQRQRGRAISLLTPREKAVFDEFARGATVREIAENLSMKIGSVCVYATRICKKLGLTSQEALVEFAKDQAHIRNAAISKGA